MSAVAHAIPASPGVGLADGRRARGLRVATPPAVVPAAYRTRAKVLGDPTPLVCTVARTALGVALGGEGINQLTRWIEPEIRQNLLQQRSIARRAGYVPRGEIGIARVRLCRVSAEAVEASVVATEGDVVHAIAVRLEALGGRWLITVMEIG